MKIDHPITVDGLVQQFKNSGSFGAGKLAYACDIYEKMVRDKDCTVFLALSGAVIPAGMRTLVADLVRSRLVDVIVSTGAGMVHDAIEALGGKHYKGKLVANDKELYKHHIFRIYDVLVPEEAYVRLDYELAEVFSRIADEKKGKSLSSRELSWELGKRLDDKNSILRTAYEENVPIFMPAVRDSEFGFVHWLHASQFNREYVLNLDAFKDVPEICGICEHSTRNGMIVIGGGVPRNTIQSATLASKKGLDYAIVITMDRPETGGLSGSTLSETISWGKVKSGAESIMVIGDALVIFPMIVAAVIERLGRGFERKSHMRDEDRTLEKNR